MGELMRRVEDLVRQITDVSNKMREDRIHAEATFVRRDVYDANRAAEDRRNIEAQKDVDDLNRHREADAQWRRQVMLALATMAIGLMVTIAIAVSNYLAR
jgi:hypothetical protein